MSTRSQYRKGVLTFYDSSTLESLCPVSPVTFYDDFLKASTVIPASGSAESGCLWTKDVVLTGGSPTVAILSAEPNGVIQCALDSTSEAQTAVACMNDTVSFDISKGLVFEARFKLSVLPTLVAEAVIGVTGSYAGGAPDSQATNAHFTADGSGELICETDDTTNDESTTSGTTLTASDWAIVRIDFTDQSDVRFYIDGDRVASGTTFDMSNLSAAEAEVQPYFGLYKASGAGVGTLQVDYVRLWQNRS